MMKYYLTAMVLLVCTIPCFAVNFYYDEAFYTIPDHISGVGLMNPEYHLVIVHYGHQHGKNLLGFTIEKAMHGSICDTQTFFDTAIEKPEDTTSCDTEYLHAFRFVFPHGKIWDSQQGIRYYLFNRKINGPLAFHIRKDDRVLKIESDFLTMDALKALLNSRRPS